VDDRSAGAREFRLIELGLTRYNEALELQLNLHADVRAGRLGAALVLLEHYPVITLGAGMRPENLLATERELRAQGIELVRTDRGGDATYHGPGQLVGYAIVSLRATHCDVHGFLRFLESVIISALADFGVVGTRNGPAGVWVGEKKICSIGIAVRGGVTYHGFALNVNPDLRHFRFINPCGLSWEQITSLECLLNPPPDMAAVRACVAEHFRSHLPCALNVILSASEESGAGEQHRPVSGKGFPETTGTLDVILSGSEESGRRERILHFVQNDSSGLSPQSSVLSPALPGPVQ
jgi:lipoate-protein ligase B